MLDFIASDDLYHGILQGFSVNCVISVLPPTLMIEKPHGVSGEEVLFTFGIDREHGLQLEQVAELRKQHGSNRIPESSRKSAMSIFLSQFKNAIVVLLIAATFISAAFGDWAEAIAIASVILINALIGFILELQASKSMDALKRMDALEVRVLRQGRIQAINATDLVVSDLLWLEPGDVVGADARIIEAHRLEIDESAMTGESVPVEKDIEVLDPDTVIADRKNMVYRGTAVTQGNGLAVVTGVGLQTEFGGISKMVTKAQQEEIPLMRKLNRFSITLIWLTVAIVIPFILYGLIRQRELYLLIETGIALAVAAIPEGLPIVATIALARGMLRLSKKKVIIKKLAAVETLGGTNIILTDKTGTLTENQLSVEELALPTDDKVAEQNLMDVAVLCNNAVLSPEGHALGDPVEVALLRYTQGQQPRLPARALTGWKKIDELPFDSETRLMVTLHSTGNSRKLAMKGATQEVIDRCSRVFDHGKAIELDSAHKETWLEKTAALSKKGLKVLAFAGKEGLDLNVTDIEGCVFLGLVGFQDPPRSEVPQAVEECLKAGIKVVMVTGDHPETARAIAKQVGLVDDDHSPVIHGKDLSIPPEDQSSFLKTNVFSRVSPAQKLDLVEYYQSLGYTVAMTGDGVNDAPALKKSDIGVAMGLRGTQVAEEAADMVLQDDSFTSIVSAIRQGRIIFGNIQNFVVYLLSCNLSEILIVSVAAFMNASAPLLPLQILFLNLVTDVFPALALGMGRGNKAVLTQRPRNPGDAILKPADWRAVAVYSVVITVSVLAVFLYVSSQEAYSSLHANNVGFFSLAMAQLVHPFNLIKRNEGFIKNEIFTNKHLWAAILFCLALLFLANQFGPLCRVLNLSHMDAHLAILAVASGMAPLVIIRILKYLRLIT